MNDTKFNEISSQIIRDKFPTPKQTEQVLETHELYPLFRQSMFFIYLCVYQLVGAGLKDEEASAHLTKQMFFAFLLGVEYQKIQAECKELEEMTNRDSD